MNPRGMADRAEHEQKISLRQRTVPVVAYDNHISKQH
jgi:hypothetical protein